MRELIVDGKFMQSQEAMYRHLARVFSLPCYFGNNLDALWDVLTENDEPTQIDFINTDFTREYLGAYGENLINLLERLEIENENYRISFIQSSKLK